ncbi:hypothetical protein GS682_33190 [Nostoc sp. B(2019)]|nr:hypothetical protein [Nostoc sp. B(2019)]
MARFIDYGHGQKEDLLQGEILYIHEPYLHYAFSKGWQQWIDKHNRYSTQEALARSKISVRFFDLFAPDASTRNKSIKPLVSKIPGWPLLYFLFLYVFRLGFLDGYLGLIYCINLSYYEFLIQIKIQELNMVRPPGVEARI